MKKTILILILVAMVCSVSGCADKRGTVQETVYDTLAKINVNDEFYKALYDINIEGFELADAGYIAGWQDHCSGIYQKGKFADGINR